MRSPIIMPRGGIMSAGGGLASPNGGLVRSTAGASFGLYGSILATASAAGSLSLSANLDTLTPALIASITGKATPTLGWLGKDASGATELVAGTDNLTDVTAPTKQVSDAILGGTCTTLTGSSATSMDAASGTVGDVGAETVTMLMIVRPIAWTSNNKAVAGNRSAAAGNYGYSLESMLSGQLLWVCDTPAGVTYRTIAATHSDAEAHVILATRSITDNVQSVWSRAGSDEGIAQTGSLTNADPFSVGDGPLRASSGFNFGACFLWIGADGDGFGEADRLAVAQALGYE